MYSRAERVRSLRYKWIAILCTFVFHFAFFFLLHKALSEGKTESSEPEDPMAILLIEVPASEQTMQLTRDHVNNFA